MIRNMIRCFLLSVFFILIVPSCVIAASSADSTKITSKNKAVVIRFSYATAEFNESWGGVMMAVPEKDTDVYTLYDVVVWSDRICLYKFQGDIFKAAEIYMQKHPLSDFNNDYAKAWRAFRDDCCLKEVKMKNKESDISFNSTKRMNAIKSFFRIVKKRTPSKHIIIKYSGHGGSSAFCGCLTDKDTKTLLKYGVELFGQKYALIDYGTNCWSGQTGVLDLYQDYTDYMIVNQLLYGGVEYDHWNIDDYNKVDTDAVYHKMFVKGESILQAAKRIARQHTKEWPYMKKNIKKKKAPFSVTVVKMAQYRVLMKNVRKKCANKYSDLYLAVKKTKNRSLMSRYKKAVPVYYNDKKYLGSWNYKNDGYGLWLHPLPVNTQ